MTEKVIKTGLCSYGMSGKLFHAPFVHVHPGFELYACWERSKKLIQKDYPNTISYDSYEDMLADPAIELIIVNTPNYTHYDFAKDALEAGKHVIVEKPFSILAEEGERLIALAKEKNLLISVYHNRRYDSDFRTIKNVLNEGLLGDITEAEFHFDRFVETLSPKTHKETPGPGTGALYDLGSHLIDQALQLFGWPTAVFADIAIIRPISLVDDYFEVLLYYKTFRVRLRSTYVAREPIPGYVLHGSKGTLQKARTNVQEIALLAGTLPESEGWGKENDSEKGFLHTSKDGQIIKEYIESPRGRYMDYFDGMYNAIVHGQPVPVEAADGVKVIKIIEAAFNSSNLRRVIEL